MDYYTKKGKRYIKASIPRSDFGGFPTDGVWLVQTKPNCKSSSCILKIGDMPSLYPFANMMLQQDELATFLRTYRDDFIAKTGVYNDKKELVGWTEPSASDQAAAIMGFLAIHNHRPKPLEF